MLGDTLAYVTLVTRDPDALASLLGTHLWLTRTDIALAGAGAVPLFAVGASALAVVPLGHVLAGGETRPGVHHIAVATEDMAAAISHCRDAGLAVTATGTPALGGGARFRVAPDGTAGVATWLVPPIARASSRSVGIERLDHLGIASADNQVGIDAWVKRLGRPLESTQTDMEVMIAVESFTSDRHGVVYHTRPPVPVGGPARRLHYGWRYRARAPAELRSRAGRPRRAWRIRQHPAGPGCHRQVRGRARPWPASRRLQDARHRRPARPPRSGRRAADRPSGRPGSRRGRIGFIHPKAAGGVLLHFVERP